MAISTYCSLNRLPPPPSTSVSSPISTTAQLPCPGRVGSWKNRCLLGLSCAIIGIEWGDFGDLVSAKALDVESVSKMMRWSDNRACLPWRLNTLETVVPENLPRPSSRRRWEIAGFSESAPPLKVGLMSGARGCFNL